MNNNVLNLDNLLNININCIYVHFVVDIIPLFNDSLDDVIALLSQVNNYFSVVLKVIRTRSPSTSKDFRGCCNIVFHC